MRCCLSSVPPSGTRRSTRRSSRLWARCTRSPTHKPHPDFGGGEFDEGKIVGIVFFEARGHGSEMLELVEEPLDEVAIAIEERAEGWDVDAPRHWFDVGPSPALGQAVAEGIAVISAVGQQGLAGTKTIKQIDCAPAVMGLARSELERDRIAVGIDESVNFRRQSAARAPHASGWSVVPFVGFRRTPFLTFAAC